MVRRLKQTAILKCCKYILLLGLLVVVFLSFYGRDSLGIEFNPSEEHHNKEDMVLIPAGEFIMGSNTEETEKIINEYGKRGDFVGYDFEGEKPRRKVSLKAFYIDKYEVTNAQYKKFLDATGHKTPHHWHHDTYPHGKENHPVINISWFDAQAYASWAGKRLPTEKEWEKAARGTDGRIYPWGSVFNPNTVGTAESILRYPLTPMELLHHAAAVDLFKGDRSPYGVYDMAGNVMEWTDSWYEMNKTKVVKGASWVHLRPRARSATRVGIKTDAISHLIGFRCAMDADNLPVKYTPLLDSNTLK